MSDEPLIAVFIDYENLALGVRDMPGGKGREQPLEIDLVLKRLLEKGRIVFKRAYCDWNRYHGATQSLHRLGISMLDIPQTGMSGKNSADIHMVVDAMDLCFSKEHITLFALLSGDSDFSPLVYKLKEQDKRVIGCGVKSSTSNLLVSSCDEFIFYDDLVKRAAEKPRPAPRRGRRAPGDEKKDEAIAKLVETVRALSSDYDKVWGSMVKQAFGRVYPGLSQEQLGYASFLAFLKDAEARGAISLELDEKRGNQLVRLAD